MEDILKISDKVEEKFHAKLDYTNELQLQKEKIAPRT